MDISKTRSPIEPSPALTHATVQSTSSDNSLNLDLTLASAVDALVQHLVGPLATQGPHLTILDLREHLVRDLTELFEASWDEQHPQIGSGFRSLICTKQLGLPRVLRDAAANVGVDEEIWRRALSVQRTGIEGEERIKEEWEVWCDPGTVVWRSGGWEWEDVGYESLKIARKPFRTIWQATPTVNPDATTTAPAPAITPARPSYAIPIRAPAVFQIPPTPAATVSTEDTFTMHDPPRAPSPSLLPSAFTIHSRSSSADLSVRTPSPVSSEYSNDASDAESMKNHSRASSNPSSFSATLTKPATRGSHRSTSSTASSVSETNSGHTQLLTPASRPGSADPFVMPAFPGREGRKGHTPNPAVTRGRTPSPDSPRDSVTPSTVTSVTPTVTPYDGGNVTVLGGGVKLGGSSRPSSVMSTSRMPLDRSRSPSVSIASRALSTAIGPNSIPNSTGAPPSSPRKARTRRRIMPTYLGHLGQPGVGGPIMGVFSQFVGKGQSGYGPSSGQAWGHNQPGVGVGMAPPQMVGGMGMRQLVPRIG